MSHAQMCLLVIGGVSAIVAIIMYCVAVDTMDNVCLIIALVFTCLVLVCPITAMFLPTPPEKQYQHLLRNISEAEKDLQKFLIDHPEFKECK